MSELKRHEVPCGCMHPVADLAGPVDDTGCDYPALKADNARLRALVDGLKPPAHGRGMWLARCPWCHAAWSSVPGHRTFEEGNEAEPHDDCPAFTPDGVAR